MKDFNVDVSIVIVTMNHLGKLKRLLASIYNNESINYSYEVIIVDNCSTDGTPDFVTENYPEVLLSVNSKINGFAHNNNFGVSLSKGSYIFICNPDVVLLEGSLENILSYAKENAKSSIVCPQLLNSDLSHQASIRGFHNLNVIFSRLISRGNDESTNKVVNNYLMKEFDKDKIQQVDWALGAAMIIKRELYNKLDGFDENFFLYVEDEDLCLRAWKLGHRVVYYPKSVMIHDHQRLSSRKINKMSWYHFKSFVYFFTKHKLLFNTIDRSKFVEKPITGKLFETANTAY